jgi:hypothetical protein
VSLSFLTWIWRRDKKYTTEVKEKERTISEGRQKEIKCGSLFLSYDSWRKIT